MATTYLECSDEIHRLISNVMQKHHAELAKAKVTIHAIGARRESKRDGAIEALKIEGFPVAAKIQISSLQDRSRGMSDAKLTIDMLGWDTMPVTRREALIDHELMHLSVCHIRATKRNGYATGMATDDLGRPKLKIRPHDWRLTGYSSVVERHGEASLEAASFMHFRAEFGQLNLFSGQVEPAKEKKSKAKSKAVAAEEVN